MLGNKVTEYLDSEHIQSFTLKNIDLKGINYETLVLFRLAANYGSGFVLAWFTQEVVTHQNGQKVLLKEYLNEANKQTAMEPAGPPPAAVNA